MAAVQPNLSDGVNSTHLKHQRFIEQIPGVDQYFLSRCYNAVDSEIVRSKGKQVQLESRNSLVTYLKALRKLARRVCLDVKERQTAQQINEITRTRAFLGRDFFDLMGFYGVDIVPSAAGWTFSESIEAEDLAAALDIEIDESIE